MRRARTRVLHEHVQIEAVSFLNFPAGWHVFVPSPSGQTIDCRQKKLREKTHSDGFRACAFRAVAETGLRKEDRSILEDVAGERDDESVASDKHDHSGAHGVLFARKRHSFLSFPYVCPEPVLVKSSFLCIDGSKRPFLLTCMGMMADEKHSTPISF